MMRLLLIIWLSLPVALFGQIRQAENLTLIGAQRILNSSYQEAIQALDEAIRLNPNDWVAYEFRAQARFQLDQKSLALQDLNHAIRLHATNPELYFRRGVLHEILNLPEEAKKDYQRAIRFNGGSYKSAENRLAIVDDLLWGEGKETARMGDGGVLSYTPYHFSFRPYRYHIDENQIQNRLEFEEEEEQTDEKSTSTSNTSVARTTKSTVKESNRALPMVSTTYDPYKYDDKRKVFERDTYADNSYTRGPSNQRVNNRNTPAYDAPQKNFKAEVASVNKRKVLIDDVLWTPQYTEVHFRVYTNGKNMSLPPDKLHILADGDMFPYLPGSYRQKNSDAVSISKEEPIKFSARFKTIPEDSKRISVISRGMRAFEKWNYSFSLSPN